MDSSWRGSTQQIREPTFPLDPRQRIQPGPVHGGVVFAARSPTICSCSTCPSFSCRKRGFRRNKWACSPAYLFGVGAFGGLFGGVLNDVLIRVTGNRRVSRSLVASVGKLTAAGLIGASLMFEDGRVIMLVLFCCKFFSDWSQPTWWGTVTDLGGPAAGRVFGMVNMVGSIGGIRRRARDGLRARRSALGEPVPVCWLCLYRHCAFLDVCQLHPADRVCRVTWPRPFRGLAGRLSQAVFLHDFKPTAGSPGQREH